jgi:hypothetical protein
LFPKTLFLAVDEEKQFFIPRKLFEGRFFFTNTKGVLVISSFSDNFLPICHPSFPASKNTRTCNLWVMVSPRLGR